MSNTPKQDPEVWGSTSHGSLADTVTLGLSSLGDRTGGSVPRLQSCPPSDSVTLKPTPSLPPFDPNVNSQLPA
jgi:hypothetical protein